jgi:hypothetical protein
MAVPGDRRLTSCLQIGSRCFSGPDVGHVLGELEDSIEVVGVDDCRHATATPGEVDRRVLNSNAVNDRRQVSARASETVTAAAVRWCPVGVEDRGLPDRSE